LRREAEVDAIVTGWTRERTKQPLSPDARAGLVDLPKIRTGV